MEPVPDTTAQEPQHTSNEKQNDTILSLPNNITIRRYRLTDTTSLALHGNNKKIWDNLRNRMPHPYLESDALGWINHNNDPSNHTKSGPWTPETGSTGAALQTNYAVCISDEAVGSIGLTFNDPLDIYVRCAEVGYWLSETHWGRGIMGLVVPAFIEWTWEMFGILLRLNSEVYAANAASLRCLEKAGFGVEGRKKWSFVKNGLPRDEVLLGMLRPGSEGE